MSYANQMGEIRKSIYQSSKRRCIKNIFVLVCCLFLMETFQKPAALEMRSADLAGGAVCPNALPPRHIHLALTTLYTIKSRIMHTL